MNRRLRTNFVDRTVGARVLARRKFLGVTLDEFAERIGVSLPQLRAYEDGSDRIGASKLTEIARALDLSVSALFGGLVGPARRSGDLGRLREASEAEPEDLAEHFSQITSPRLRRRLMELFRAAADRR